MKIIGPLFWFLFSLLSFATTTAYSTELDERKMVKEQAEQAYSASDFSSLNRQFILYGDYKNQRTSSGAFKMTLFFDGISNARNKMEKTELQEDIRRTENWAVRNRDSLFAYILQAGALQYYGGYFRGGGYANTVSPEAWKIFKEYTQKATEVLVKSKRLAGGNAEWQSEMLGFARLGDLPEKTVQQLFDSGLKENPFNYRLYFITLEYYMPKWHGSPEALDKFIQYSVVHSPAEYGQELYARLYSGVEQSQFQRTLYSDSLVDWKKMKVGLELWVKRFPTSWNRNIFAYHACIAGDKETLRQLLAQIGKQPEMAIWEPDAQSTFNACLNLASNPSAKSN